LVRQFVAVVELVVEGRISPLRYVDRGLRYVHAGDAAEVVLEVFVYLSDAAADVEQTNRCRVSSEFPQDLAYQPRLVSGEEGVGRSVFAERVVDAVGIGLGVGVEDLFRGMNDPVLGFLHHHTLQGALPVAQSFSSSSRSRMVSIGCQKPVWWKE